MATKRPSEAIPGTSSGAQSSRESSASSTELAKMTRGETGSGRNGEMESVDNHEHLIIFFNMHDWQCSCIYVVQVGTSHVVHGVVVQNGLDWV